MRISIVLPAYNEEQSISSVLDDLLALRKDDEIIVVDDGSTDNTYAVAKASGVRVIRHPYNKGYGAALKTGLREAQADVVVFLDADGQHSPADIERIVEPIGQYSYEP